MAPETLRKWIQQDRPRSGRAVYHSDARSKYTSVRFAQTLLLAGLMPSISTVGDALVNALAETTIGLYKTECIRQGSPFRTSPVRILGRPGGDHQRLGALVQHPRLMRRLGPRPPS